MKTGAHPLGEWGQTRFTRFTARPSHRFPSRSVFSGTIGSDSADGVSNPPRADAERRKPLRRRPPDRTCIATRIPTPARDHEFAKAVFDTPPDQRMPPEDAQAIDQNFAGRHGCRWVGVEKEVGDVRYLPALRARRRVASLTAPRADRAGGDALDATQACRANSRTPHPRRRPPRREPPLFRPPPLPQRSSSGVRRVLSAQPVPRPHAPAKGRRRNDSVDNLLS